ncbi:MAG TPA: EAL domain-containing protein [Thermoanaerobaculia bacterium]|jgi:diguanylate cyclase (GGDEF)-like protein/PAS domain S-box-containing protein|nr:EAL domain-containing protein [Thermoanaerobaculia bacterium]
MERRVSDRREGILAAVAAAAEVVKEGEPWRHTIGRMLAGLGEATQASRVYLYERHVDGNGAASATCAYFWQASDAPPPPANPSLHDRQAYGRWLEALSRGEAFAATISELPPNEREFLAPWAVQSFLLVPVFLGKRWWGNLGLSDCRQERHWSKAEVEGLRAAGGLLGALVHRQQAEEALRESEGRFRLLVQNVPGVVYLCRNDPRHSLLYLSEGVEATTGHVARDFLEGRLAFADLYHSDDVAAIRRQRELALRKRRPFLLVYRLRHRDGGWRWIEERGQGVGGDEPSAAQLLEGSMVDVTARKQAEEQLVHHTLHDQLTGLANRALFADRIEVALARCRRQPGRAFAVLLADLDRFKLVNDSLGHAVGDRLLLAVVERLRGCLRDDQTLARLGGDEFALLLEDLDHPSAAVHMAESILSALASPFRLGELEVHSGASIGIVHAPAAYRRSEELLRDADTAMHHAKALGRNRQAVFDGELHQLAVARLELENDLRRALARQELVLYYQPLVSLPAGRVVGFEALLRWRHPRRGLLLPETFLQAAAETGTLVPIGRWALREACRQVASWQRWGPLSLHFNLHAVELADRMLESEVRDALAVERLPPDLLNLELTEHALLEDLEGTAATLERLRALGVGISLDDFGTGYSSLSSLHRLPLTMLKVDRSLVRATSDGARDGGGEILRTILALGAAMRLQTVAEGVEEEGQLALLRALGYPLAQGSLFAPALPADAAPPLLAADRRW